MNHTKCGAVSFFDSLSHLCAGGLVERSKLLLLVNINMAEVYIRLKLGQKTGWGLMERAFLVYERFSFCSLFWVSEEKNQSALSAVASPPQVNMLRTWVSLWSAHSHPLMHVSTWLILITPHSFSSPLCTGTVWLRKAWCDANHLKRSAPNLHTFSGSPSVLTRRCVHVFSISTIMRNASFNKKYTSPRFVTASRAASFLFCGTFAHIDFCRKAGLLTVPCGCQTPLNSQTETWNAQTSCIHTFFSPSVLQLSASPLNYQSIPRW